MGQTAGLNSIELGNNWEVAQGIVTGSNGDGYTLTSIEASFPTVNSSPALTVTLHKDAPTNAAIATLSNPASIVTGTLTFTAPADTTLIKDTTYYVLFNGDNVFLRSTSSNNEDSSGLSDWSVENDRKLRDDGTTGPFTNNSSVTRIAVNGTVNGGTTPTTAGVTVSESALTVTEEDTTGDTYTVVLDSEPTSSVTVEVAGHASTDVSAAPASLTFTTSNWSTAKTVTVTAVNDTNTADETVSLTHSATSSDSDYDGITIAGVTVEVEDNDTAKVTGVSLTPGDEELVVEWTPVANATGYQVQWKSGGQGYNNSGRRAVISSGSTASHTISGLTNGTTYTVRMRATRTGANPGAYSDEEMDAPEAAVAAGVTVSETALTVEEEDSSGDTYTVVLNTQPTSSVTVEVAGHASTDVSATPASLTFTTSNWSTAKTVTVTAVNDTNTTDETVSLTHSATSSDSDYGGITIAGVTVEVEDNDTAKVTGVGLTPGDEELVVEWTPVANATGYQVQWKSGGQGYNNSGRRAVISSGSTASHTISGLTNGTTYTVRMRATRTGANPGAYSDEEMDTPQAAGVTVSETALTVTEEDTAGETYTVVLNTQPTSSVTIAVAGTSGTDVSATPASLTFTTSNWSTARTVTVTADNDTNTADETVSLTHGATSSDSNYDGITIAGVTVEVEDNDTAKVTGVVLTPGDGELVVEWVPVPNATGYQVQWKSGGQSYNNSGRQATIGSGSTASHTISGLTNGTTYTVRMRATRTGANHGAYSDEAMDAPEAPGTPGVTVSETALTVEEEDTTGDTYTVVLNTQPTSSVTVEVAGHASTDVSATPASLTFTTSNWSTAKTVTVTAGNDANTADETINLTHSATSSDSDYGGITIAGVTVEVEDNDTAKVTGVALTPGDEELGVAWTAVANATGYQVQWKSGGQSYNTSGRQATISSGSTVSHTISSLTNGTTYTVRMRAVRTGANNGPYSDEEMDAPVAGNTLASGAPAITGGAQVGKVLTAGLGTIADSDGLPGTFPDDYTFQWVRVDADGVTNPINKGTDSSTYTVVVGDVGKKIFVEMSFTDGGGTLEDPLPSAAYPSNAPVAAAAGACPADNDWCTTLTVGFLQQGASPSYGFATNISDSALVDTTIDDGDGTTWTVSKMAIVYVPGPLDDVQIHLDAFLPRGSVFDLGGTTFTAEASTEQSITGRYRWDLPAGFAWVHGQDVTVSVKLPESSPASGAPEISGTPQVGEMLTADTAGITDADGLTNVSYTFQWIRVDANGTSNPVDVGTDDEDYTLVPADEGKRIKVKVTFTDDAGNDEELTSVAYLPSSHPAYPDFGIMSAQTACPADNDWCATMTVGYASLSGIGVHYGFSASPSHGALDDTSFDHDGSTVTVEAVGIRQPTATYHVRLDLDAFVPQGSVFELNGYSFTADADAEQSSAGHYRWAFPAGFRIAEGVDYRVSLKLAEAGNTLATGKPSISGTAPQVGMTLTAGPGDIDDADGLTTPGYTYQWTRGGNDIVGATGTSYTLSSADYGQKIQVRVSFTDDAGFTETRASDETLPVAPVAAVCPSDAATVWCTTLTVGHKLEEEDGYIDVAEAGYEARSGRTAYGSVNGATFRHLGVDYTVTALLGGGTIDLYFATEPNLPADGAGLTVHVQKFVGELDVPLAEGALQSQTWFFQGVLNTSTTLGDTLSDAPLIHAPASRDQVIPHPPDLGTKVMVRLSRVVATGPATGKPEITGTIEVGETLMADTSRIADADGLTSVSYSYQWIRVDGTTESNIAGATGSSYTLVTADEGKGIRVRVSFNDDAGNPETLTSDVYRAVTLLPAPRLPAVDDPNAIWMATLTVADLGSNQYGYKGSQGGLTDTAFTYLGDDTPLSGGNYQEVGTLYTIDELSYHTGTGQLLLSLDDEFVGGSAANIFVDVGGTQRSFSQGTYSSVLHTYTFTFPNPSWSAGDEVTVKIVVLAEANGPESLAATIAESGDRFDVMLTWDAPTGGGTVTGYRVEYQPDPALQWRTLESSQAGTSYTDSGLGRGTVRYYRVAALRSGGASYSQIVRVQAPSETQEVPEKVNLVEVKPAAGSDTALEVAWNRARTPDSRAPATGYHVQHAQHDGAAPAWRAGEIWASVTFPRWMERLPWRTWSGAVEAIEFEESTERSPTLKTVVTGLAPGTNYRVRVRGCTEAGCGEWSYPRRWTTSGATLNATEAEPLTATLEDFPVNHDGSSAFTFRIAFSAEVVISRQDMKEHALTVVGGTVTRARRVDRRKDLWELTVEPAGTGAVSVLVPLGRACTETGALCTADGQALSMGLGHSVPGPAPAPQGQQALEPLAAGFVSVPAEHDGETAFWLELSFDAAVEQGSKRHIRALLGASGGSVTRLRRKEDDRLDHWRVRVEPSSHEAVTVTLSPSPACGATGAVCTEDGRTFTTALATQIQGPPGLTVADAEVEEAANATLAFAVTLSRAPSGTVTVGYATSDGTATAGSDYTAASGTLTFAAGETAKTVSVPVLDDAHDEGSETLTLTLSNASGAYLEDGTATGTINNTDPMPQAWLARFGRTVGTQVVDALGQRLEGATASHVTVGGIPLTGAPGAVPEAEPDDPFGLPEWATRAQREESARSLTANDLLLGSAFHLSSGGGQGAGAAYTAWGRVATSGFAAEVDGVTMDADVTSGLVGFDAEWARVLAGVMFSHSTGEGDYRLSAESGGKSGRVESSLTGVYPYARVALNARMSAWALAGAASGELTLKQEGDAPMPAGIAMRMGAAGFNGRVLDGTGASGLVLDVKSDALWVGTKSEDTSELAPTEGDVTRLRVTLAGERAFAAGEGARFTPSAEVGLRHDGGEAESGTGLEVGAGLSYVAGALTVEGQVRTLVAHEDSGYEEWGVSGTVRITPSASGRGLMLRFAPQWGRTASAVQRLWSAPDASALGAGGEFEGGDARLVFDAGYGVGLGHGRGVLTPYAGLVLGDAGGRTVRTGARWQVGADAVLGLEGTRRTSGTGEAGNELMLRVALRF